MKEGTGVIQRASAQTTVARQNEDMAAAISVTGNVSVPLSEIDRLRALIVKAERERDDANRMSQQLADKQMQIRATINLVQPNAVMERYRVRTNSWGEPEYGMREVIENKLSEKIEYLNLEDVRQEFILQAETRVTEKIARLNKEIAELQTKVQVAEEKLIQDEKVHKETVNKSVAEWAEKLRLAKVEIERRVALILDKHSKEVQELEDTIKVYRDEETEKTKDRVIRDLQQEVRMLKMRKWYEFF